MLIFSYIPPCYKNFTIYTFLEWLQKCDVKIRAKMRQNGALVSYKKFEGMQKWQYKFLHILIRY